MWTRTILLGRYGKIIVRKGYSSSTRSFRGVTIEQSHTSHRGPVSLTLQVNWTFSRGGLQDGYMLPISQTFDPNSTPNTYHRWTT